MQYELISTNWNAEPNDPNVTLSVNGNSVILEFYVNSFQFDLFKMGEKGTITFQHCYKFAFNNMNDEGYYRGNYRYKHDELPWGEFYKLDSNWESDFPSSNQRLATSKSDKLSHYLFFFKDNTFECVAESFILNFVKAEEAM